MSNRDVGLLSNDFSQTGGGRWAEISKSRPGRALSLESDVLVPFAQSVLLGITSAIPVSTLAALTTQDAGISASVALLTFGVVSSIAAFKLLNYNLSTIWHSEYYTSETALQHTSEQSTVRIEVVEPNANGSVKRMLFDQLNCTHQQLALVASAERLSKRGLMETGLNDSQAMSILGELLKLGYIRREADNKPAVWTSKGKALIKALPGGGGGGGALETSETSILGE